MTALTALSAGVSLYQGYAAGQTAQAQAEAQALALEQNAKISRAQAHDAIERGGLEELKLRRQLAQLGGNQRAQAAASGIDINSGSALDVQNASISEGEFDAETIRFNAARAKWGYDTQANNLEAQAANSRAIGKSAKSNALFGGIANFGLTLGEGLYSNGQRYSPLTESATPTTDDRSKYWGPVYNPYERRRRGYS
ncbi:MAG: hypothetical protein IJG36_03315 [Synergistaceae bacterium]|nr:hypothetical protein [Synergistaceae bacterium]